VKTEVDDIQQLLNYIFNSIVVFFG